MIPYNTISYSDVKAKTMPWTPTYRKSKMLQFSFNPYFWDILYMGDVDFEDRR